jgi:hypothetical protein
MSGKNKIESISKDFFLLEHLNRHSKESISFKSKVKRG